MGEKKKKKKNAIELMNFNSISMPPRRDTRVSVFRLINIIHRYFDGN